MGLFRDLRKLSSTAKELQQDWDPAEQMRQARAQMQQLTAQSQLAMSATAVNSPATVVALRDTGTMADRQPISECDVTVMPAGGVPFAATVAVHGVARLGTLTPGATVTVSHEPGDQERVVLL